MTSPVRAQAATSPIRGYRSRSSPFPTAPSSGREKRRERYRERERGREKQRERERQKERERGGERERERFSQISAIVHFPHKGTLYGTKS